MKILLNFNKKFNNKDLNKLGGIEGLNLNLFKNLKKKHENILFKEKINSKIEFLVDFYFYVVKSQYKTTRNGKRYILLNVINESGFFDLRLFDDKFDVISLQTQYIKARIKTAIKNDFFNVNIDNLLIIKNDDLINQINHISYKELLDLDKVNISNNIRVRNDNKILNISLN